MQTDKANQIARALMQFTLFLLYRVDARLGTKIAEGLGVELEVLPV